MDMIRSFLFTPPFSDFSAYSFISTSWMKFIHHALKKEFYAGRVVQKIILSPDVFFQIAKSCGQAEASDNAESENMEILRFLRNEKYFLPFRGRKLEVEIDFYKQEHFKLL